MSDYHPMYSWSTQIPALIAQAAPVQNTWYPVLTTARRTRVKGISLRVDVANETLEARVICDGVILTSSAIAAVAGNRYIVIPSRLPTDATAGELIGTLNDAPLFTAECRASMVVSIRKTTALGAGVLYGKVLYDI